MSTFNQTYMNPLAGKVVLLVTNDAEALQAMTLSLAARGADIAALCTEVSVGTLDLLQESVETVGQQFLALSQEGYQAATASETMAQVTACFGQLDVLIDLTTSPSSKVNGRQNFRRSSKRSERDWGLIGAALREMMASPPLPGTQ